MQEAISGGIAGGVAAAVVVPFVLIFILLIARAGGPAEGPRSLVFRYGAWLRVMSGALLFGPLIGITVLVFCFPPKNEAEFYAIAGCYALFTCLGVPLVWETMRWKLVLDDAGLTCHSPWRGRFFIAWPEVREVVWAQMGSYFIIKGRERWFRVSPMASGVSRLLGELEKRVGVEKMRGALPGHAMVGRPLPADNQSRQAAGKFDLRRWNERRRRDGPDDITQGRGGRDDY
jgi:hypothetical protein